LRQRVQPSSSLSRKWTALHPPLLLWRRIQSPELTRQLCDDEARNLPWVRKANEEHAREAEASRLRKTPVHLVGSYNIKWNELKREINKVTQGRTSTPRTMSSTARTSPASFGSGSPGKASTPPRGGTPSPSLPGSGKQEQVLTQKSRTISRARTVRASNQEHSICLPGGRCGQ